MVLEVCNTDARRGVLLGLENEKYNQLYVDKVGDLKDGRISVRLLDITVKIIEKNPGADVGKIISVPTRVFKPLADMYYYTAADIADASGGEPVLCLPKGSMAVKIYIDNAPDGAPRPPPRLSTALPHSRAVPAACAAPGLLRIMLMNEQDFEEEFGIRPDAVEEAVLQMGVAGPPPKTFRWLQGAPPTTSARAYKVVSAKDLRERKCAR